MIENGRIKGVPFQAANSFGGPLEPTLIVLHDTAGRLDKGSSVAWFRDPKCPTSAHFVVERDGSITQMVRTDRRAWHAGQSAWQGRSFCNAFSLGIEIVNPGKLDAEGNAWFGHATNDPIEHRKTPEHGDGCWLPYTTAQIAAVKTLCRQIIEHYPAVNDITTHWAISPGRKVDPNPLLPLDDIVDYAIGRSDEPEPPPAAPVKPTNAPPASMAASSTGNTAIAVGGAGGFTVATEVSQAMQLIAKADKGFSIGQLVLALAQSLSFWLAVLTVIGSIYIWLRRCYHLHWQGV